MSKVVNIVRRTMAVGLWLVSGWYGILIIVWNIGFFNNFLPGTVAALLGFILIECLPIIFILSWVFYGFSSVTPLLTIMVVAFVASMLGYFFMPKGE